MTAPATQDFPERQGVNFAIRAQSLDNKRETGAEGDFPPVTFVNFLRSRNIGAARFALETRPTMRKGHP